jgi:hypothetical protein
MHHILFCLTSVIDSYTTLNMVCDKCTIVPRLFAMCDTSMRSRLDSRDRYDDHQSRNLSLDV